MKVRISSRFFKISLISLIALGFAFILIHQWVIPTMLVGKLEAMVGSRVEIQSWWINGSSAGVRGLKMYESRESNAKLIATAPLVTTDLNLGSILRGNLNPSKLTVSKPELVIRLDKNGQILFKLSPSTSSGKGTPTALPKIVIDAGTITFDQDGRPNMVVTQVNGRIGPDSQGLSISALSSDPTWGPLQAQGQFTADFATGKIDLKTLQPIEITPELAKSIPFTPALVWDNVLPTGQVVVSGSLEKGTFDGHPLRLQMRVDLLDNTLDSPSLGLNGKHANGTVLLDGALVKLQKIGGQAIGGFVTTDGTLDFGHSPPTIDVTIDLKGVDVGSAPERWQLKDAGVTGKMTGQAHLLAAIKPNGIDLSGTSGEGVVESGTIEGIPFKSLKLALKADGDNLQYETPKADPPKPPQSSLSPPLQSLVLQALQSYGTIAFQPPADAKAKADTPPAPPAAEKPAPIALQKPKTITTQLELEDVDLALVVAKAQAFLGYPFPIPISGKLALKAEATIPFGTLQNIKSYGFHGDLTLTKTSIFQVDFSKIAARVDLTDGVLDLKNFRGELTNHPDGGPDNPPEAAPVDVPIEGPLTAGTFRGDIHAEIAPLGKLQAKFDSVDLPLGELAAPSLPRPTPLSGLSSIAFDINADLSKASEPEAWTATGVATSRSIRYQDATLTAVNVHFGFRDGAAEISELTAILQDKPLKASGKVGIKAPRPFEAKLNVSDWAMASILKWIPNAPPTLPIAGTISGDASASGTLLPLELTTTGTGKLNRFQAGSVALGDVPFGWRTQGDDILITLDDSAPFGGGLKAEGTVPLKGDRPIKGSLTMKDVDTAKLSALLPSQNLGMTGRVTGHGDFSIPKGSPNLDADLKVASNELVIRGLPAENVDVSLRTEAGNLHYELKADSLGGKVKLNGLIPILGESTTKLNQPNGGFQAVNFKLDPIWKALGQTGMVAEIHGRGAIDANLRASLVSEPPFMARGVAEFRDLTWGLRRQAALGSLKGVVAFSPETWRLDPLTGTLLGGQVSGRAWGTLPKTGRPERNFEIRLDRLSLSQVHQLVPPAIPPIDGYATIRLAGANQDTLRANGDISIPHATVAGFRVTEVKLPATFVANPSGTTSLVHLRQWSARLAGGSIRGDTSFRVGESHAFQTECRLNEVELETIAKTLSDARRPASGKINGTVFVSGANPNTPKNFRGRFNLDLSDASLVALPIFRELDKFLGSARGGLFEDGSLDGTISNGQFNIETMTLEGRIAQVHATGTMGFDGQLNLEVLVNTNQIIPQTGQALVALIPGLSNLNNRSSQATQRVSSFLSNRLLKLRVTGTAKSPSVTIDPGVAVADTAVGFFGSVLKLPLGFLP